MTPWSNDQSVRYSMVTQTQTLDHNEATSHSFAYNCLFWNTLHRGVHFTNGTSTKYDGAQYYIVA